MAVFFLIQIQSEHSSMSRITLKLLEIDIDKYHEDAGLIPGLAQWVGNPVLP